MRNLLLMSLVFLTSCTLISNSISSPYDREISIQEPLQKVIKAYSWQTYHEFLPFVSKKKNGMNLARKISRAYEGVKIHTAKINDIEFSENSNKAFVVVEIEAFSKPSMLLQTHFDQIQWEFSVLDDGWKISDIDIGRAKKTL